MSETEIYVCECCKEEFEKAWSDEEADVEAEIRFGVVKASQRKDMAVVCHDCYLMMFPDVELKP